jgi:hypothetical protein
MTRPEPIYKAEVINRAGRELASATQSGKPLADDALQVIGNWRSSHGFPLNTMKLWLLKKAREEDSKALVAQRLKRMSSIASKLNARPTMKLSQMQDIAGCRAIVKSVAEVYRIANAYRRSEIRHELVHIDDYIAAPKDSGYRGIHFVYRYKSDKKHTYDGLKVEIQIRSSVQHAWATAVETVGVFTKQALKSSQGSEEWLRFFALMSSAISRRERTFGVPNTPDDPRTLREELREYTHKLDVESSLLMFATAMRAPETVGTKNAHLFLMTLSPNEKKIRVTGYQKHELELANAAYLTSEREAIKQNTRTDSVLVSVETFAMLKKAFPNYFLDTNRFIELVRRETNPTSRRDNPAQRILPFPYFTLPTTRSDNKIRSVRTGRYI